MNVTLFSNVVGPNTYNPPLIPTPPATYKAFEVTEDLLALVPVTIILVLDKERSVVS